MKLRNKIVLLVAVLTLGGCRLSVSVTGDGSVSADSGDLNCPGDCSLRFKRGTEVVLQAIANTGSFFASWEGCDAVDGDQCVVVGKSLGRRRVKAVFEEDVSLADADISADILQCALDSEYEETDLLSSITSLTCKGTDSGYSYPFDPSGVERLQNLNYVEITGGDMAEVAAFADLGKLTNLKLYGQALTDVTPLLGLDADLLEELDLDGNPDIECVAVADLVAKFGSDVVYTTHCL